MSVIVFAEIQLLPLYQIDQCEKDGSSGAREDKGSLYQAQMLSSLCYELHGSFFM